MGYKRESFNNIGENDFYACRHVSTLDCCSVSYTIMKKKELGELDVNDKYYVLNNAEIIRWFGGINNVKSFYKMGVWVDGEVSTDQLCFSMWVDLMGLYNDTRYLWRKRRRDQTIF